MMIITLAWRNLWRSKRRTFITMAMIFLAVILSVTQESISRGVYERNINTMVTFSTGYIQVSAEGHNEDKTLETSLEVTPELEKAILEVEGVSNILRRIENGALVATDSLSREAIIMSTDPEVENDLTGLSKKVTEGEYFSSNSNGVLIGVELAKRLKMGVGDTIVILSMGYHGNSANGMFEVCGLLQMGSPELNKRLVYLPMHLAQPLFSLPNRVSYLSVLIDNPREFEQINLDIKAAIGEGYESKNWEELLPELAQLTESDAAGGYIMMGILYLIISFGIFGTILMMLAERRREFGVVSALGMKRWKLAIMVIFENVIIGLMGALVGMMGAFPVVSYFKYYPIRLGGDMAEMYEQFGFEPVISAEYYPDIFINNAIVVFVIIMVLSLYPLAKLTRLKPLDYLRS